MQQIQLFYKSDFKVILGFDGGWTTPFRLLFYTNSPSRSFTASYDGSTYTNCSVLQDGRLQIAFDSHNLGLGTLMLAAEFYLTDTDYADHICNARITPFSPVFIKKETIDGEEVETEYNVILSLTGATTLDTIGTLPAFYKEGPRSRYEASDHATATADHTQAATDHTTAATDHATATSDHTTAATDHATATSDHTTAAADHAAYEEDVEALKTDMAVVKPKTTEMDKKLLIEDVSEDITIENRSGEVVAKITSTECDFKNLKSNGMDVVTDLSGTATKEEFEELQEKFNNSKDVLNEMSRAKSTEINDAVEIVSDDGETVLFRVTSAGVYAKSLTTDTPISGGDGSTLVEDIKKI